MSVTIRTRGTGAALAVVVALAVGLAVGGCGSASATNPDRPDRPATPAPAGLPGFYSIPATLPSTAPGTLIKSEQIAPDGIGGDGSRRTWVIVPLRERLQQAHGW